MTEVDQALEDDQDESTGVYRFEELSDKAKDAARCAFRDSDFLSDDWYEYTYEDAVRMGALLGIEISQRTRGNSAREPAIWFELHVQGAGACYEGRYAYQADAVAKIKAEAPQDTKLHQLAERLTTAQTTARMLFGSTFTLGTQSRGRSNHSASMEMAWSLGDESADISIDGADVYADEIEKVLREFADWIYHQLEAEFDYQVSDECVDEYLSEKSFTGDGEEIA